MIRKNKNINSSCDPHKTDFGPLVPFVFLTFALGFKNFNITKLTLLSCKKVIEVAYLKIRF